MARDEHAAAWSEAHRVGTKPASIARYIVRVLTPANAAASGTVSASGGAMSLRAKSRLNCESVERGMARSRVGCVAGSSLSKGRTTPSQPSGLSRGLLARRLCTDAATPTEAIIAEQNHDTQLPGRLASLSATRRYADVAHDLPETRFSPHGGGAGREHLDAPGAPLQCSWDDLKGRRSRVDVPERTCCFEELGTAPRVDVDAGLLRSGSDPIRVDVGRESAVTCAGLIRRDSGVVREDRGCEGARRESSVGRTGAIGGVVGSHRARSGSDPAGLMVAGSDPARVDGRQKRAVGRPRVIGRNPCGLHAYESPSA